MPLFFLLIFFFFTFLLVVAPERDLEAKCLEALPCLTCTVDEDTTVGRLVASS